MITAKNIITTILLVTVLMPLVQPVAYAQESPMPYTENWLFETAIRNSGIELAYSTLSSFWGIPNPAFDSAASEEDKALIYIMLADTSHISVFLDIEQEGCDYFHSTPKAVADLGILGRSIARAQRTLHELRNELLEESVLRLSSTTRSEVDQLILDMADSLRKGTRVRNNLDMEQRAQLDPENFLESYQGRCGRIAGMRERLEAGRWQVYGENSFMIE